jgi:ribonuclease VapC
MVIDTSAVMALLLDEPDSRLIDDALMSSSGNVISTVNHVELMIVVETRVGASGVLLAEEVLNRYEVQVESVTPQVAQLALTGWRRFGKGRHPADLNLGDIFAYGLAMARSEPLLFVGNDFSRTDVLPVLVP